MSMDHPDRLGPYVLVSRLGRGGTGIVFAGVHEQTGQRVAVKVVHLARSPAWSCRPARAGWERPGSPR